MKSDIVSAVTIPLDIWTKNADAFNCSYWNFGQPLGPALRKGPSAKNSFLSMNMRLPG